MAKKEIVQKFVDKLNELTDGDPEGAHSEADKILLEALCMLGYPEIASAWTQLEKRSGGFWYA